MNNDEIQIESEDPEAELKAEQKVSKLRDEIETLRKEKQEYLDGWQRAKADYVNALKRFGDDLKSSQMAGTVEAIKALLPAHDSLERARQGGEVPAGFSAIARQIESGFKSLGVTPLGELGDKFDPTCHEALGQDPVDHEGKDGFITTVLEPGYKLGNYVVRPARVRVGRFEK